MMELFYFKIYDNSLLAPINLINKYKVIALNHMLMLKKMEKKRKRIMITMILSAQ